MTNTNPKPVGEYLILQRRGLFGAPTAADQEQTVTVPPHSTLICDAFGRFRAQPFWTARTVFNNLPAASLAAGKDEMLVSLGTGTEVIARSTKGGVNVKTQASSPADNDNAMLVAVAANAMNCIITSASKPRFSCRVALTQITELFASLGMDENLTDPNPAGTAGDGAKFLFDPGKELNAAAATGTEANWVMTQKKAGADTYTDTGVPVIAGREYELEIAWGADLKPEYYIDGKLVGTGVANTANAVVGVVCGVQINAASPAGQKDIDIRYISLERSIG